VARGGLKTVCVDLPDYIVSMLEDLSKLLNATPSQLLAKMLHPVYEVWRAAREADVRGSATVATSTIRSASTGNTTSTTTGNAVDVSKVVEAFLEHYKSGESRRVARLSAEDFVTWLSSRGLNICSATAEHVDEYVNNALAGEVSQRTLKRAAGALHNFLAFAKPRLCKHSAKTLL
jgi:hypothetical protein